MFEWDEDKNRINKQKHGISFEEATEIFNHPVFTAEDTRQDYGELREISIGLLEETIILAVVHTDRKGVTRLISARKAKKHERRKYYEHLEKALKRD